MRTVREEMIRHLEWLKKERVRVSNEIDTLQHGLVDIDETIENWTKIVNNNTESQE